MNKAEILAELEAKGYEIIVTELEDCYEVTFSYRFWLKSNNPPHQYSLEWTVRDIKLDCVDCMLAKAGLRVVEVLECII